MTRTITCIECPTGCKLIVEIIDDKVTRMEGNKCPKGEGYAASEIENPVRILTSTVLTKGLLLKLVPVRTDRPIQKAAMIEAAKRIRALRIDRPLARGSIVVQDFMHTGANLITTRDISS